MWNCYHIDVVVSVQLNDICVVLSVPKNSGLRLCDTNLEMCSTDLCLLTLAEIIQKRRAVPPIGAELS